MEKLKGIYPALQATFDESGEIDVASMERQVSHCIEAGTHGLVFPVMGGELFYLSESERKTLVEAVVTTASGQVPVVAGVSAPSAPIAAEHARHAKKAGADAVVALPPFIRHASLPEKRAYFQAISDAAEMPIFIQHSWPGMNGEFIAGMIRDIEHVRYVKEEAPPSGHSISDILAVVGDECLGVFGGAHGRWMISEMRRGATGFIPAAQSTEVYVAIWDAFQAGDESKAREIFALLSPFLDVLTLVGLRLCKEVLVRRGVIKTATMRMPNTPEMDEYDRTELDVALRKLEPYISLAARRPCAMRIKAVQATVLKDRVFWAREIEQIETIRPRATRTPHQQALLRQPLMRQGPPRQAPPLGSVLVEIETDDGLAGVGIGGGGKAGAIVVETCLRPLLIGEDALAIEQLWEEMYRATFRYGQAGLVLMAMSGIDLALWDLKGRALEQPVWRLLGGKVRDTVPVYATIREAGWAKAQGFSGIKLGGPFGPADGSDGMQKNEAYVAALRERLGPEFDIMIDCARTWDVDYTIEMARLLEPYRIMFIEEPILSTDTDGYVRLRRSIDSTLIACGEHVYTRYANQALMEREAVNIIQPDIRWTGGLSETLKICDLAAKHGIAVMPHRGGMAWSLHLIMARPECTLAEGVAMTPEEAEHSVFTGEPVPENGHLAPSDEPGFGLVLQHDRIERFRSDV